MKKVLLFTVLVSLFSLSMMAQDGDSPKAKVPGPEYIQSNYPPLRSGGEDIAGAVTISALPFNDGGTTCGAADNYAANCGCCGGSSGAPDLVYSLAAGTNGTISVHMTGFDTFLQIRDSGGNLVACDDDSGGGLSALIANFPVVAGQTYFIVVEGYANNCGNYNVSVTGTTTIAPETPLSPWVIGLSVLLIGTFIVLRKTRTV